MLSVLTFPRGGEGGLFRGFPGKRLHPGVWLLKFSGGQILGSNGHFTLGRVNWFQRKGYDGGALKVGAG